MGDYTLGEPSFLKNHSLDFYLQCFLGSWFSIFLAEVKPLVIPQAQQLSQNYFDVPLKHLLDCLFESAEPAGGMSFSIEFVDIIYFNEYELVMSLRGKLFS